MFNVFFSAAISVLIILALVGCMRNIAVVKSLDFIELDLSSIAKNKVFPTIYSDISTIPSYIKIGLVGYCTPDFCVGNSSNFAKFDIEKIIIDVLISSNSVIENVVESSIDLVLPNSFSNYINTFNKIIDGFTILLVVWIALSIITLILKIVFFVFYRGFIWSIIYNFIRTLSSIVGVVCAVLATVGLFYGRKEFNKNDGDDLGLDLIVGKVFIIFLWVAVALSFIDQIFSLFTPSYFNRRVRRQTVHPIIV